MSAPSPARRASRLPGSTALLLIPAALLLLAGFLPNLPAAEPAILPTPTATIAVPPAQITNPKIGLHTRLADEPDPEKIRQEFTMLRDMGASWATEFFPWLYIHPFDKDRYDWAHAD
jgi:hypothetical protein